MGGFIMKKKLLVLVFIIALFGHLSNTGTDLVKQEDVVPVPTIAFNLM